MTRALKIAVTAAVFAAAFIAGAHADLYQAAAAEPFRLVTDPAPVQAQGGGVINIGQAFGPLIQPYVDAIVQALLAAIGAWVVWILKTKLGINIDAQHRDALIAAAQRQASSLVAAGFVKVEQNGKVSVDNAALADAANHMLAAVPDAVKHFGIDDPNVVAKRIVDALPQVPSVASAQGAAIAPKA